MGLESAVIEPVVLSRVDWDDRRFALESHRPVDDIRTSIARHGLLTPPWVLASPGGTLVIVDGFKRMRLLHERGEDRVVCAMFPSHTNPRDLWLWRLEARLHGAPLNPAEKSQVAAILTAGPFEAASVRRLLDGFGLPHRPENLEKWVRLSRSDQELMEAAAAGAVHERAALELAAWPERCEDRGLLISILRQLHCSASIQVEIVEGFREIAARRRRPAGSILGCPGVGKILEHRDWNHREKTQALREWLDEARLPRLKARERQFAQGVRRQPPPAGTALLPPPAFEGNRWRLEIVFSSGNELRERLRQLRPWSESAAIEDILAPGPASHADAPPQDDPSRS